MMRCERCGHEGEGAYCARCGAPLSEATAAEEGRGEEPVEHSCPQCGTVPDPGDLYCSECGAPVRERPRKRPSAYTPWILSALALVAFAVGITLLVRAQSSPRVADEPLTGGIIAGEGEPTAEGVPPAAPGGPPPGGEGAAAGGMPTAGELAEMPPREAADRLFNRAMSLWGEARSGTGTDSPARSDGDVAGEDPEAPGGGAAERARFFAEMGVRAYRRVPAVETDADLRFHVGLLQLVQGDTAGARAAADTILAAEEDHLLGLLLAARAAEARGDDAAAADLRERLREGVRETDLDARPEYDAHRALLEAAAGGEE